MIRTYLASFIAFAYVAAALPSAASDKPSGAETLDTKTAIELGRALHAHDQAGWHATDRALEELDADTRAALRGYVVVPAGGGVYDVAFYSGQGEASRVVWTARMKGAKVRSSMTLPAPRPLSAAESLRQRAINTVVAGFTADADSICPGHMPLNSAVLEDPDSDDLFVYLLTPMTAMDQAVFGRHHRFRVSADGTRVLGSRRFTNSCAIFPTRPPQGASAVGIVTNHLLDDTPQETHVFVSLQHDQPVYVSAGEKLWKVTGKRIREQK